jgi:hypothetical protein
MRTALLAAGHLVDGLTDAELEERYDRLILSGDADSDSSASEDEQQEQSKRKRKGSTGAARSQKKRTPSPTAASSQPAVNQQEVVQRILQHTGIGLKAILSSRGDIFRFSASLQSCTHVARRKKTLEVQVIGIAYRG